MRLSYSVLVNYLQCPFRALMLSLKPPTLFFEAQANGIYAHEYVERYLLKKYLPEPDKVDLSDEAILASMGEGRIYAFDIDKFKKKIDEQLLIKWSEQVYEFLRSQSVIAIEVEKKIIKKRKSKLISYEVSGIIDIIATTSSGEQIVIDLKRSNLQEDYDAKQVTLYNWLLDEKGNKGYLCFLLSDGSISLREFQFKTEKNLLHWMLHEMDRIAFALEYELNEYFPAKMYQRTCHPQRCGVYYMCPYVQENQDYEVRIDEEYI